MDRTDVRALTGSVREAVAAWAASGDPAAAPYAGWPGLLDGVACCVLAEALGRAGHPARVATGILDRGECGYGTARTWDRDPSAASEAWVECDGELLLPWAELPEGVGEAMGPDDPRRTRCVGSLLPPAGTDPAGLPWYAVGHAEQGAAPAEGARTAATVLLASLGLGVPDWPPLPAGPAPLAGRPVTEDELPGLLAGRWLPYRADLLALSARVRPELFTPDEEAALAAVLIGTLNGDGYLDRGGRNGWVAGSQSPGGAGYAAALAAAGILDAGGWADYRGKARALLAQATPEERESQAGDAELDGVPDAVAVSAARKEYALTQALLAAGRDACTLTPQRDMRQAPVLWRGVWLEVPEGSGPGTELPLRGCGVASWATDERGARHFIHPAHARPGLEAVMLRWEVPLGMVVASADTSPLMSRCFPSESEMVTLTPAGTARVTGLRDVRGQAVRLAEFVAEA